MQHFTLRRLRHAAVALALVVGLVGCNADTDNLVPDTDSAPYLVLNAVSVGATLSPTRSDAGAEDAFAKLRPITAFPDGAVVMMGYSYDGMNTMKFVYAKRIGSTEVWKTYESTDCVDEIKIRPNATESWEKMGISFIYHPEEVVGNQYCKNPHMEKDAKQYYYDRLGASVSTEVNGTSPGSSIGNDGKVRVSFLHEDALVTLANTDIHISGYGDGYTTISAMKASSSEDESFTPNTDGNGWSGIILDGSFLSSLDITLTNGDASADKTITVSLATAVEMKPYTRYKLTLTLTPDKATATITEALGEGWTDEEEVASELFEGTLAELKGFDLAVKQKHKFWTITDEADVYADIATELKALHTATDKTARISLTMPNCTAAVGEDAFKACVSLTSVTFPKATSVGIAFDGCTTLTTLTFNTPITSWGLGMFGYNGTIAKNITLTLAPAQKEMEYNRGAFVPTATDFFDGTDKTKFCDDTYKAIIESASTTTK